MTNQTNREKIIEIIRKHYDAETKAADEILALLIEVPSDEESRLKGEDMGEREDSNRKTFIDGNYTEGWDDCYVWMKEQILKRNGNR